MKKLLIVLILSMLSFSSFAGGADFYVTHCIRCHGEKAQGQGIFPKLAGKDAKFIVGELVKFKAKTRKAPFPIPIKENLTDSQMKDVAAYLSTLK